MCLAETEDKEIWTYLAICKYKNLCVELSSQETGEPQNRIAKALATSC